MEQGGRLLQEAGKSPKKRKGEPRTGLERDFSEPENRPGHGPHLHLVVR